MKTMKNFDYCNPTRIVFGKGSISRLPELIPSGSRVLMLYGGGSIKRNGVYEQVVSAASEFEMVEFGGIEPNPAHETCVQAIEKCRKENVNFILAVGGGSVLDSAKYIAAALKTDCKDPWQILTGEAKVTSAVPLAGILTLPATGSESNGNSVISKRSTKEKRAFGSPHVYPKFSILDPETTFSLPHKQVRNGVLDAFVHVCEQYMCRTGESRLQDRFAEAILQTLIEVGPDTIKDSNDYDKRADFMWSATMALNMLISQGVTQDWSTHMIGHELTAFYGVAHAESLAIVLPGVWRFALEHKGAKLAQYGKRIWGVSTPQEAIDKTEQFFQSLNMPVRLSDYEIDADEAAARISERFRQRKSVFGEDGLINADTVGDILKERA
jgi:NADP-dependent alcohol dehydrogenase